MADRVPLVVGCHVLQTSSLTPYNIRQCHRALSFCNLLRSTGLEEFCTLTADLIQTPWKAFILTFKHFFKTSVTTIARLLMIIHLCHTPDPTPMLTTLMYLDPWFQNRHQPLSMISSFTQRKFQDFRTPILITSTTALDSMHTVISYIAKQHHRECD